MPYRINGVLTDRPAKSLVALFDTCVGVEHGCSQVTALSAQVLLDTLMSALRDSCSAADAAAEQLRTGEASAFIARANILARILAVATNDSTWVYLARDINAFDSIRRETDSPFGGK